ncbi:MAG: caspase family protein, partial [Kangiellaceae bacterium]|nr:caspase family protein [Kangiellaceae bacterium]
STWVALDEQGRYDSNSPGDLPFASWVSDDSPLEALPIEVFMNDFFKPRLIPRLLSGEQFSPVKSIASINRVRPKVSIEQVEFESNTNRLVTVTVKVSEQSGATRDNSTSSKQRSGFQGLRLFRDNKQVAYSPVSSASETNSVNGLKQSTIVFNGIQLPASDSSNDLIFSSYAFNRDNIKSATTSYTLTVKPQEAREKPKAYVIAIGVNEYNNPAWDLTYAVPDANAIHQQVVDGLQSTGKYSDVISINLSTGDDVLKPSKETIRQVLAKLSGKGVSTANTELTTKLKALKRVKPEDTVLISYSGHGYASADGDFHLFPWDIAEGNERTITPELLQSTITSEDLNEMLRDIDSDNFLMVIDACNSSASVEGKNFKPGPMGSSGLGQLAYNKQMMILTASQAEEFALESDQLNHGLLTYSLVEEGLRAQSADRLPKDNSISAREWLSYAINRVPELYQSLVESPDTLTNSRGIKVVAVAKDNEQIDEKVLHETVEKTNDAQRPGLFDFSKNKQIIISNHQ